MMRNITSISETANESQLDETSRVFEPEASITFNPDQHHPLLYHLAKVPWAVMGTVTWRKSWCRGRSEFAARGRARDFNGVLHLTCRNLGLRQKYIQFYRATEFGVSGECHLHFLVAKSGLGETSAQQFGMMFGHLWEKQFRSAYIGADGKEHFAKAGLGIAKIMPYDLVYKERGVAYCLKREFSEQGQEYERDDALSPRLLNLLKQSNESQAPTTN